MGRYGCHVGAVFDAVGGNAQRKRSYGGNGGLPSLAVGHHS